MAKEKQMTLYQSATVGGRVIKQGYLVQFVLDGNGAIVTPIAEWTPVEKWALSRFASGNRMADRGRVLDQLTVMAARPGSFTSTKGSTKPLEDLCKLMMAAGFDLNEWQLPPELRDMGRPPPPEPPKKKPAEDGEEKPSPTPE